jgi:hypothetical protein
MTTDDQPVRFLLQFLLPRLRNVAPDKFDVECRLAFIELASGKVPIHRSLQRRITAELHRLLFPNASRDRRDLLRVKIKLAKLLKRDLVSTTGMTVADAEDKIGKLFGISADAVHKMLLPSRRPRPAKGTKTS